MKLQDYYIQELTKAGLLEDKLKETSIRYAMLSLKNELVKSFFMIIIFYILGFLSPFLWVFVTILPIRMTTGGLHFDTNVKCFIFSLGFFFCSVIFFPAWDLPETTYTILLIGATVLILSMPLSPWEKRPIISTQKYRKNKILCVFFLFLLDSVLWMDFVGKSVTHCIIWALFFHAIQLSYLYVKRKGFQHVK